MTITTKQKLTVGYITQNDSDWLILSLESIEHIADEIVIIDGGSDQSHVDRLNKFIDGKDKYKWVYNKYPGNNGLQYSQILKYATGDWILILDSDEVVNDNAHMLLEYLTKDKDAYAIKMNHCINDLAHIDSTYAGTPKMDPTYQHYSPLRLFRNNGKITFTPVEHSSLIGITQETCGLIDDVTIWHYGKAKAMMDLKHKYEMNIQRSTIHSKEFLSWWYNANLTGSYPVKLTNAKDHPSVVRREFYIG